MTIISPNDDTNVSPSMSRQHLQRDDFYNEPPLL